MAADAPGPHPQRVGKRASARLGLVARRLRPVYALLAPCRTCGDAHGGNLILARPSVLLFHDCGNVPTADASRLAALLVGQILPVFLPPRASRSKRLGARIGRRNL